MSSYLVIQVRLHDGRYHGAGDWPPSPARLYQALIAGVGLGGPILESTAKAFQWQESLPAPEIIVPQHRTTSGYTNYVPNNDLDAKKGDPGQIGGIRTGKTIRACLFDDSLPLRYLWHLPSDDESATHADAIIETASRLYQFGRGVDMAWAIGEILGENEVTELRECDGFLKFSPDEGSRGFSLPTPVAGSYQSLRKRYKAGAKRFTISRSGKSITKTFIQPPQPRFRSTSYNSSSFVLLFELRHDDEENTPHRLPLVTMATLTAAIRDSACERLRSGLSEKNTEIDRCLLGKNSDGSHTGTSKDRITVLPLPSIGYHHADMLIRRVAVFVSPNCRISIPDLRWAFSNLKFSCFETPVVLLPASNTAMLGHYAVDGEAKSWRTITPVALPDAAARRRIAPERKQQEAKNAEEKAKEEGQAVATVMQALRHAGCRETGATVTRIQRVPFQAHGKRVEDFALSSRFSKERLWHVEIQFAKAFQGPLILGDGRFYGLGLFAPVRKTKE